MCSYKFSFNCSKNEAEYEALIVDIKILKKLGAKKISLYGKSILVIKKDKWEYSAKRPRMRAYSNVVLDILNTFTKYTLSLIPRNNNLIVDALSTSASMFKLWYIPARSTRSMSNIAMLFLIVFGIGNSSKMIKKIDNFFQMEEEFVSSQIDDQFYEDDQEMHATKMKVLQLKYSFVPRGLVPLAENFYHDYVVQKQTMLST